MDAQTGAVHDPYMPRREKNATPPQHFLRKWRKLRGFSIAEAAAEIGISHASLGRIERGKQEYTQAYLERLAWLYKCTPSDLLSRDPTKAIAA